MRIVQIRLYEALLKLCCRLDQVFGPLGVVPVLQSLLHCVGSFVWFDDRKGVVATARHDKKCFAASSSLTSSSTTQTFIFCPTGQNLVLQQSFLVAFWCRKNFFFHEEFAQFEPTLRRISIGACFAHHWLVLVFFTSQKQSFLNTCWDVPESLSSTVLTRIRCSVPATVTSTSQY